MPDWKRVAEIEYKIIEHLLGTPMSRAIKVLPPVDDATRVIREAALRVKIEKILKSEWARVADGIIDGSIRAPYLDLVDVQNELMLVIETELARTAREEMQRAGENVGVEFDITAYDKAAREWAHQYTYDLVRGINDTTRGVISNAITKYTEAQGMTRADVLQLLDAAYNPVRANAIATTETSRAYGQATRVYQDLMTDEGIPMERVWHTNADDIVCPICRPLNGKPESQWGGVEIPAHVNCRCGSGLRLKRESKGWVTINGAHVLIGEDEGSDDLPDHPSESHTRNIEKIKVQNGTAEAYHLTTSKDKFENFRVGARGVVYLAASKEGAIRGGTSGWNERNTPPGMGRSLDRPPEGSRILRVRASGLRVFGDDAPKIMRPGDKWDKLAQRQNTTKDEAERELLARLFQDRVLGDSSENHQEYRSKPKRFTPKQIESGRYHDALNKLGYNAVRVIDESGESIAVLDPSKLRIVDSD